MYRASLVLIVLIVSALLGSGVRTLSPAAAQIDAQAGAGTRPVELLAGWNLVGWTGDDASVPDALGDALPAIDSVHTFDAARQAFDTFTTSGPGFLNTLDVILSGAGVWLFANTGVTWQQPRITGPRDVELVAGFNLVAWTGPGTFIGEAVAGIAGALDSLFVWNAPAEEFLTFGPTRPAFLNRIDALAYGDGFWLRMTQAVSWTQPDVGSEAVVASDDGSVTLTIPPGALPAGVPASTIRLQIFDGGPDALVSVLIGPDGVVFDPPATLSFLAPNGVTAALVASAAALDVRVAEARARPPGTDLGAAQLAEGEVLDLLVAMRRSGSYFLLDSPFEASLIEVRPQALVGQELLYRPTVQNLTREFSFFALIAPPGGANPFPDPVPTEVITVGLVGAFTMNPGRVCEVAAGLVLKRDVPDQRDPREPGGASPDPSGAAAEHTGLGRGHRQPARGDGRAGPVPVPAGGGGGLRARDHSDADRRSAGGTGRASRSRVGNPADGRRRDRTLLGRVRDESSPPDGWAGDAAGVAHRVPGCGYRRVRR